MNEYDKVPAGYPVLPEISYSARFGFEWKGVDFSIMFQGTDHSNKLPPDLYIVGAEMKRRARGFQLEAWTPEYGGYTIPIMSKNIAALGSKNNSSTLYSFDTSYLRLKNLTLGYTLPKKWANKIKLSKIRIFMNGFNLYTWGPTVHIMDPEASNGYLPNCSYTWGVNVNF